MAKYKNQKYYKASTVAWAVCNDLKEGDENFAYYLGLVFDAIRELEFDNAPNGVKVVELDQEVWKQIAFPEDMVDLTKIGIRCGNMIKTFTYDSNMPNLNDIDENCDPKEAEPCPHIRDFNALADRSYYYSEYPFSSYSDGKYYGYPSQGNNLGFYDVDMDKRVINFRDTVDQDQKIYLEYITDGIDYEGDTPINPYTFELMKLYVKWQRLENNDEVAMIQKERAKRNYTGKLMDVEERLTPMDLGDIREALRSGYTLVPQT